MTENYLSERSDRTRPVSAALWTLGGIALVQGIAFAYGVLQLPPIGAVVVDGPANAGEAVLQAPFSEPADSPAAPSFEVELPPIPPELLVDYPLPGDADAPAAGGAGEADSDGPLVPDGFLGPALDGTASGAVERGVDPSNLEAALGAAAAVSPISDEPILEALVKTGAGLRASGNTQGAMQAFREVETALPENPRVLSEIAATLGLMGLREKASAYWERVEGLGEIRGGAYFAIAGRQLRGEAPPVAPAPAPPPLKIGEIQVEEQTPDGEGQRVSLRIVIDADPASRPNGADMALLVYFYDIDSGGTVRPSTADTSYLYPTEPYDWQVNGTEEIVVNYHQPAFSEEETRNLGERRYHGYAIELYYLDLLQDKVAMPEEVAALRFGPLSPAGAGDQVPSGPDNALFPDPANP